jgi:hypothetical protein
MPGMSGFELLSVVRSRFPKIKAIAMSSALPEEGEPRVAAEVFFKKGTKLRLLQIVEAMHQGELPLSQRLPGPTQHDISGEIYVAIDQLSAVPQNKMGSLLRFNSQRNMQRANPACPQKSYTTLSQRKETSPLLHETKS